MTIGIDISQIVYEGTGVAAYVRNIVFSLTVAYPEHSYVLFGASLRKRKAFEDFVSTLKAENIRLVAIPIPPTLLDILWNRLHIFPVEWFTGNLDVFWSSDWTQPPLIHAKGVTTIHDLSTVLYPEESHNRSGVNVVHGIIAPNIVATQERRLKRAKDACSAFFCDSEATQKDAHTILGIPLSALFVVYPGYKGENQ